LTKTEVAAPVARRKTTTGRVLSHRGLEPDAPSTGLISQIRAFRLERGIAVRQGLHLLRAELRWSGACSGDLKCALP
jgi:hypothetical protein